MLLGLPCPPAPTLYAIVEPGVTVIVPSNIPPAPPPLPKDCPPEPPPATIKRVADVAPVGTVNVPGPVDVTVVVIGALIVILNCLVALASSPVAVTVNVDVVSEPTALAVPVIKNPEL